MAADTRIAIASGARPVHPAFAQSPLPTELPVAAPPLNLPAMLPDATLWQQLFGGAPLTAAELTALCSGASALRVANGQLVFSRQDGEASGATWVVSGDVALGLAMPDGSFKVERIVRGPAWLDMASVWLGAPPAFDAQAMNTVVVVSLATDRLRAEIARQPSLGGRFLAALAGEVRALAMNTQELMHKDAQARLAAWLHQRSVAVDSNGNAMVQLRERKRDIAAQLAITPETLSRLMRSFTQLGILSVQGYTVQVHDSAALARLAEIH